MSGRNKKFLYLNVVLWRLYGFKLKKTKNDQNKKDPTLKVESFFTIFQEQCIHAHLMCSQFYQEFLLNLRERYGNDTHR